MHILMRANLCLFVPIVSIDIASGDIIYLQADRTRRTSPVRRRSPEPMHTDHMDPETLIPLTEANPDMKIVLPAAWYSYALQFGLNEKHIRKIEAGEQINLAEGLSVEAIPSAHEEIETDADGNHLYLGYIIYIWYSGQT